jgi:FkbM family methyltransferase
MALPGTGGLRRYLSRFGGAAAPSGPQATAAPEAPPPVLHDPERLEHLVPPSLSLDERVAMAARCRDSDAVPKVPGAGRVHDLPDGRRAQLMHNGVRVLAGGYHGDWMTRLIELCRGHHEPQEELVFHEVVSRLPPGGTMLELGGFWAFYSIWFLRAAPGRRALLVEPDPAHSAVGEGNLALNGVSAEFIQGFLGASPGEARPFATEDSGTLDLRCLDVPGIMAARGIERLTILHCDIQGAEFDVLRQSADLLRERRVDWVLVSTHHHLISGDPLTHQRCLALLLGLGAAIEAEHDVQESYSGDGLICARFGPEPAGWRRPALSHNRASQSLFRHPLLDLAAAAARPPAP